jgi:hypothetical protein
MKNKKIDPDFDGHPEKPMKDMTPKEKLQYISDFISFYYIAKTRVKKPEKTNL